MQLGKHLQATYLIKGEYLNYVRKSAVEKQVSFKMSKISGQMFSRKTKMVIGYLKRRLPPLLIGEKQVKGLKGGM